MKKAIYAGSFDPPTKGHIHIIFKAANLFRFVEVVIATNQNKKPMFSELQRVEMLKNIVSEFSLENVTISVLPHNQYLVHYADEVGAKIMVRGLRDQFDFYYENKIYAANRNISKSIETVYLMPDGENNLISSSDVKSHVGLLHWESVVAPYVTEGVIDELRYSFLKSRFEKLIREEPFSREDMVDEMWEFLREGYSNPPRFYHNLEHINYCLSIMDRCRIPNDPLMEFALWFHDIVRSERDSADIAEKYLKRMIPDIKADEICMDVRQLIMATKHEKCVYKTEREEIIASIDLGILGESSSLYDEYSEKVFLETKYKMKNDLKTDNKVMLDMWIKGRKEFLSTFLKRDFIYPWGEMRLDKEVIARDNLSIELSKFRQLYGDD